MEGRWIPFLLRSMACGKVSMELPKQMKSLNGSKAYIITGHSLKTKTPVVSQIETILGSSHVGTLSSIGQHAPVKGIINGMKAVEESGADILISIGGGSPIDSAKAIIYRLNEKNPDVWLPHIAIPTTLSAAECTSIAGYTTEDDRKTAVQNPHLSPSAIIYDAELGKYTPQKLWLSSGLRALDHAIESLYHPEAVDIPTKRLALEAIRDLFNYLPKSKEAPEDLKIISHLQTAAFASLGTLGQVSSGIGLSHSLGYALGSSYGIPHGITSCLTLSSVIELKSKNEESASQLARALPYIGIESSGNSKKDAQTLAFAVDNLVKNLGLKTSLKEYNVPRDQDQIIVERALRKRDDPAFNHVLELVQKLW